jgi:hypothetical protein
MERGSGTQYRAASSRHREACTTQSPSQQASCTSKTSSTRTKGIRINVHATHKNNENKNHITITDGIVAKGLKKNVCTFTLTFFLLILST